MSHWSALVYGLGEISNAIKMVIFGLYAVFFATVVVRVPGTWIGVVGLVTIVWDAAIDPYIGYLSDRRSTDSQRYSMMLLGALTMGVGFWAFFSPPRALSTLPLVLWLLIASLIVRTATSVFSIPYYAIGATLSSDYDGRTSIAGVRGITSIVGTSLAAALSFVVFFPNRIPGVDPKLDYAGYRSMGAAFGLLMTAVSLAALWRTFSLRRPTPQVSVRSVEAPARFFATMRLSLRNRSFRVILVSSSLGAVALAFSTSLMLHYLTYYVGIKESAALSRFQVTFYAGGLVGTVFWLRIAKNVEKHRLYMLAAVVTSILMTAAFVLFGEGHALGGSASSALLAGYGLAGFFNCILWFMPSSMLADVADEREVLEGNRREGVSFGVFSFTQQVAAGIAVMLAGGLLEHFAGMRAGDTQPGTSVVRRIGLLYGLLPAASFVLAALVMQKYKLTRGRIAFLHAAMRELRIHSEIAGNSTYVAAVGAGRDPIKRENNEPKG